MIQKELFSQQEFIDAICRDCASFVKDSKDITIISACFAKKAGFDRLIVATNRGDSGGFCNSEKPKQVTEGGTLIRCPEGKWWKLI